MNILKAIGTPFTALSGTVNSSVEQKILIGLARHAATVIGGALMGHGAVQDVIGALLVAVAAGSSVSQKMDENKL